MNLLLHGNRPLGEIKHSKIPKHRILALYSKLITFSGVHLTQAGKCSRVKMLQKLCFITGVDRGDREEKILNVNIDFVNDESN